MVTPKTQDTDGHITEFKRQPYPPMSQNRQAEDQDTGFQRSQFLQSPGGSPKLFINFPAIWRADPRLLSLKDGKMLVGLVGLVGLVSLIIF